MMTSYDDDVMNVRPWRALVKPARGSWSCRRGAALLLAGQDRREDLQLAAAVRAVLHRQNSSRIHRKTPDQAAPKRPLLSTR